MRLFKDQPKWEALNRTEPAADATAARKEYLDFINQVQTNQQSSAATDDSDDELELTVVTRKGEIKTSLFPEGLPFDSVPLEALPGDQMTKLQTLAQKVLKHFDEGGEENKD